MFRITLNSLWSHKRRLVSTCVAVILGVAFMAGTLVLTSTVDGIFDDLFSSGTQGIDAVARGEVLYKDQQQGGTKRAYLPQVAVTKARAVPGVAAAEGQISTEDIAVLDKHREPMGGNGPPTIVGSWVADEQLNPYRVIEGNAPKAGDDIVVDRATANDGPFAIGDRIRLETATGPKYFHLAGIVRFGKADSAGGVVSAFTTLPAAQKLIGEAGKIRTIEARADAGVTAEALVARLERAKLAPKVDIVTGKKAGEEQASEVKGFFKFFSTALLIFAAIALFVGAFIISNTFGILLAQRTRELALLRAVGATRRQILASVLLEAGVIGVISAVLGFVAGVGLASLALWALKAGGGSLPSAGITVLPSNAIISILVGLIITALSAVLPAIRATRVPPIAALREIAIDTSGRSRLRAALGGLLTVLGAAAILPAFHGEPKTDQLPGIGGGMALLVVGLLVLGPVYARPLSFLVGSPLPFLRGITGRLSRENAMRNPRRTASTASALIIGVTLIVFITAFAASVQTSISNSIGNGFKGEYIIQPANQQAFTGVTPKLASQLEKVRGVRIVAAASFTPAQVRLASGARPTAFVGGIDAANYLDVFNVKMQQGSLTDLRKGTVVVDRQIAEKYKVHIGDRVTVLAASGRSAKYRVAAVSDDANLLGQWTLTRSDSAALNAAPTDAFLGVRLDKGTSVDSIRADLKKVVKQYPTMKLQDRDQFIGGIVGQIDQLLVVIYGLLFVSVIIALIGIANTLSLSIHERTRELGLLRAMGMTRSQLRSSVRWEAAIVALMGTAIGLGLGLLLSWTMVKALASQGFSDFQVPLFGWLSLSTIVIAAAALGVVAALRPAHKAAKLNVLDAIATE